MKPRVLIVDTPYAAPLVSKLLGGEFDTTCATSWAEALLCLKEKRPEVVLLGYHFDETHPYRFIQHLRSDPMTAHVPVLVLRGVGVQRGPYADEEIRDSYKDLGADDYLVIDKTVPSELSSGERERLAEMVRQLIGRRAP